MTDLLDTIVIEDGPCADDYEEQQIFFLDGTPDDAE